ncbi:hypothetical protein DFH07DRAFT_773905, partial [Mycena maculata]
LQYISHSEILTVTWPTNVHEGYKWVVNSLIYITQQNKQFVFETNTRVQFLEGPHAGDARTPDFIFGRKVSDGPVQYFIIVESGFSQSSAKLESTAAMHLTRRDVIGVICIDFESKAFTNPSPNVPRPQLPVSRDEFLLGRTRPLGPIVHEGHTWAHAITGITLTIYMKASGEDASEAIKESWVAFFYLSFQMADWCQNVTPIKDDPDKKKGLHRRQSQIVSNLRLLTRGVIAATEFTRMFPTKNDFTIDWDGFYDDIGERLLVFFAK